MTGTVLTTLRATVMLFYLIAFTENAIYMFYGSVNYSTQTQKISGNGT